MYIPNPYFNNIPQVGNLELEYIFLENGYPVLFTCRGTNGLYLCLCYDVYEEQKWLVSPITSQILFDLINNNISIRDALTDHEGLGCKIFWKKEYVHEKYICCPCHEFDDDVLPDDDVYLDEDEEYSKYYLSVKIRENEYAHKEFEISENEDRFIPQPIFDVSDDVFEEQTTKKKVLSTISSQLSAHNGYTINLQWEKTNISETIFSLAS